MIRGQRLPWSRGHGPVAGLCVAMLTAGCVTSSPAIPAEVPQARLALERRADPQHALRTVRVHFDDRPLTALASGEQRTSTVTAGLHRMAVDLWDVPGQCTLTVALERGQTVDLLIEPHREVLASSGAHVPGTGAGRAVTLGDFEVEGARTACDGAFRIRPDG